MRPQGLIDASESFVGLPKGQMGNSEVGHMNLGAGRVAVPDLPRIDHAIADGSLAEPDPGRADRHAEEDRRRLPSAGPRLARRRACPPGSLDRARQPDRGRRRAGVDPRLPRRPRYAAAQRARVYGAHPGRPEGGPADPVRHASAAATTPWTATSAGTASSWPTTPWSTPKAQRAETPDEADRQGLRRRARRRVRAADGDRRL